MKNLGDFLEDAVLDFKFNTATNADVPITLAGTPALAVYKSNGTTETTAGITLTVDFDSLVGMHHVRIDLSSDAFYASANDYQIALTAGTVDGVSVIGVVVAEFSIENRAAELGIGVYSHAYTLTDDVDGNPIANALVWVTSDLAGDSFLYSGYTDEFGVVTFKFVSTGTYYFWRLKAGVRFVNPDTEVVS